MSEPATNGACVSAIGANWSAYSLQGRTRERNSDAFAVFDRDGVQVFALGDGVGTLPSSPVASRAAVDAMVAAAELGQLQDDIDFADALSLVDESVGFAVEESHERGATTLLAAAVSEQVARVVSVGDSEAHEIPQVGASRLLHDLDHVPAQPNVLLAWIDGHAVFEPHRVEINLQGSYLCLMSDGIPGSLSNARIAEVIRGTVVTSAARELVLSARQAGANDDLTAIVVAPLSSVGHA